MVVDKNMGPIQAMKASRELVYGYKWTMAKLTGWSILIVIAGFLALVVGLLVAIPVAYLLGPVLYVRLNDAVSSEDNKEGGEENGE